MKRRNFLKLCCAAVVAPSLPLSKPVSDYDKLKRLIECRIRQARRAMIDDLEEYFFDAQYANMPTWLDNADNYSTWEWVKSSVVLNYKKQ